MKRCGRCKEYKAESCFTYANKKSGKLQSYCRYCTLQYQKERDEKDKDRYNNLPSRIQKLCKLHDVTVFVYHGRGQYECRLCKTGRVTKARKTNKLKLVSMLGGGCKNCGYSKCVQALDFHHVESSKKDFELSRKLGNNKLASLLEEVEKCVLLCSNCHRELHAGTITLE